MHIFTKTLGAAMLLGASTAQAATMGLSRETLILSFETVMSFETDPDIGGEFFTFLENTPSPEDQRVGIQWFEPSRTGGDAYFDVAGVFTSTSRHSYVNFGHTATTVEAELFEVSAAAAGPAQSWIEFDLGSQALDGLVNRGQYSATVNWYQLSDDVLQYPVVVDPSPVPLPASLPLLAVALGGLGYMRKKT